MKTRIVTLLVALVVVVPGAGADQPEPAPPSAAELVRRAAEAWELHHDPNAALQLFDQAVAAAPDDAAMRLRRGMFLETVAAAAVAEQQEELRAAARADYEMVADADPDGVMAGVARDGLTRLSGRELLASATVSCPVEAVRAFQLAESLFSSQRHEEAMASYATATGACPGSAPMWVAFADAHFVTGRFEEAAELFERAVAVDPWSREGHRYLSDTYTRLGRYAEGLIEAAAAVASDPTYEAGWGSLRSYAIGLGGEFTRRYGGRATVRVTARDDGGDATNIEISLPALAPGEGGPEAETTAAQDEEAADPDQVGWVAYSGSKALALSGTWLPSGDEGSAATQTAASADPSPFEVERRAVETAISAVLEGGDPGSGFWAMMARANAAGFLDEAVYLHLMSEDLVDAYRAYREQHRERILSYLTTVLVRLPAQE